MALPTRFEVEAIIAERIAADLELVAGAGSNGPKDFLDAVVKYYASQHYNN